MRCSRDRTTPAPVRQLLGQALALSAALASALKFSGSFSVQAKGDGPISLLLTDCTDRGALRGYARVNAERFADTLAAHPELDAATLLGAGYLAFTVDQGPDRNRHQGIVAIEGATLADMALHYFATSEQLRCWIRLAAEETPAGWRASALILEKIAGAGGIDPAMSDEDQDESWRTATALAATVTDAELLDDSRRHPAVAASAVCDRRRGGQSRPRPVLRMSLLPCPPVRHSGRLSRG